MIDNCGNGLFKRHIKAESLGVIAQGVSPGSGRFPHHQYSPEGALFQSFDWMVTLYPGFTPRAIQIRQMPDLKRLSALTTNKLKN